MIRAKKIWMDGKIIDFDDAKIHVLTHSLHYANAVFEGTRAYKTQNGLAIFRLKEHTKRLLESAKITLINSPFSQEELENAQVELLRVNDFQNNTYLRPLIFLGDGTMGVYHAKAPVRVAIAAWEWGAYLGEEGLEKGIKVKISSFARNSVKSSLGKAKASANYLNSQMAKYEAIEAGYEEALMLDEEGFIAEGTGECFFMVKDGKLITPPNDFSLKSITQDTVLKIAHDLGISVVRQRISRDEVYVADEAFFTGTAAEITPINNIDARIIGNGKRGELTTKLQNAYFDIVYGRNEKYASMLTYI
ncbi:branched-chain amino-acid aminotransferase [Campylobacter lari CCUG 22395]|uniref:Branched-chain-amino-acid aminotransferase n=1 Tax=Campylobacter lari TaxID=201 RepID=A0A6L1L1C5_CAMLA|nr:branched-chain-amino-acid transaminase [Campylobacter lari]AJD03920.1 branched-chain amino-acid aminotransferase [Campylobacter lari CCUG 22395]EAK9994468.1 branched-chain-amino-acid transaminase [Campylobacter lari]EAK9994797.1 branched-chain-amino-acid transaminase [Campylobacter lari]MCV3458367.1 branched-chain-amino-acid transaminase [Campylobacter lari]HEC1746132.1 branched-chain-amino-acid transaminase [Campylobacter lari]